MGNCSYLMSEPCNQTTLPHFEVHADNENRFNRPTISYLKAVHVHVHMVKISILKGGTVQVRNGGRETHYCLQVTCIRCWKCTVPVPNTIVTLKYKILYKDFLIIDSFYFVNNHSLYDYSCSPNTGEWDQYKPASYTSTWCVCVQVRKALHCVHELWCDRSLWWKSLHGYQSNQRVSADWTHAIIGGCLFTVILAQDRIIFVIEVLKCC